MIGFYASNGSVYAMYQKMLKGERKVLKYFPTIPDTGWDKNKRRFKDQELNSKIVKIENAIIDIEKECDMFNLNNESFAFRILEKLTGKKMQKTPFFDYCDSYYLSTLLRYKKASMRSKQNTISVLRKFNPKLTFEGIDKVFYRDFMQYLRNEELSLNYTGLHIKNLKSILNHATDTGINTNLTFREFKKPTENVFNVYLTEDEITAIYNLKITDLMALEVQKETNPNMSQANITNMVDSLENARKLFIIGCRTGLRVENYLKIDIKTQIEEGFLNVISNKGYDKLRIPLHQNIIDIINSGEYPKPMSQQRLNDHIKILGQLAADNCKSLKETILYTRSEGNVVKQYAEPKYKLIKSHTARRTFCSLLYLKGVPVQYIMAISGHHNESMFRKYTAQVKKDEITSKLLDYNVWG